MAAAIVVSALLPVLFEKLPALGFQQLGAAFGVPKKLAKLRRALLGIQSMLGDAEERQIKDKAVRSWLAALKDAAYDADDILDEFNLHVQVQQQQQQQKQKAEIGDSKAGKVHGLFSPLNNNPVLFRFKMGKKLDEILERIDELVRESQEFNFTRNTPTQAFFRPPTHSYIDESTVIGREGDKESIISLLVQQHSKEESVTVLSVVGMGGLGKTTLAQLVYNDERVKVFFQPLIWVCVSEDFDVVKLVKAIIESASGKESVLSNMELLQRELRELLSGRRYLLVLDDVWNQDPLKWDALRTLLWCGGSGSRIVVTTRDRRVSHIMGSSSTFDLALLSEADSWTLFERRAFAFRAERNPELVEVGREIVSKCGRLPLAVKLLGSLMQSKTEVREWLSIKNSEIWNLEVGQEGILPALKLSYHHLPPHLKQCFAFCAIFPKDYLIEKEVLIQLWMANGFVLAEGEKELEVTGHEIFTDLAWRSFLQNVRAVEHGSFVGRYNCSSTTCKMHDLIHDLAQSVMGNECSIASTIAKLGQDPRGVRHLLLSGKYQVDFHRTSNYAKTVHTFMLAHENSYLLTRTVNDRDVSEFVPLRVLDLHDTDFSTLPASIKNLRHLRYLDLSNTRIASVPESITTLWYLQTLNLSHCKNLCKLPDGMSHLSNLRHLYLHGCPKLEQTPSRMGQLSFLQTLTKYVVGTSAGTGIGELKDLNLGGKLELYNLKYVRNPADAKEARLDCKANLRSLLLAWGGKECRYGEEEWQSAQPPEEDASVQVGNAEEMVEALKPHTGLRELRILNYCGLQYPNWMKDSTLMQNIVEIHLEDCRRCEDLPPLWNLPFLEVLRLKYLNSVKHICGGSDDRRLVFPSLTELVLDGMQNLEKWCEDESRHGTPLLFPCLRELVISNCPKLKTMPQNPSLSTLETLRIDGCEELVLLLNDEDETRGLRKSLRHLTFRNCNCLFPSPASSPRGLWENLPNVISLTISSCDSLLSWPDKEIQSLTSLQRLRIEHCRNLTGAMSSSSFYSSSSSAGVLKDIEIFSCEGLEELPRCPASFQVLSIKDCPKLRSLTEGLQLVTQLQQLQIWECPSLLSLPEGLGFFNALNSLDIQRCPTLQLIPEGLPGFNALQMLRIIKCPKLKSFPESLKERLPRLELLQIYTTPYLLRKCKRGGEYWHLVSHIPSLEIDGPRHFLGFHLPPNCCPAIMLAKDLLCD